MRVCAYCSLPVAGRFAEPPPDQRPANVYCCSGCRLADAIMQERAETGTVQQTLIRLGLAIFFAMNVMVFTMAMWSRDVYADTTTETADAWLQLLRYASLLFATPVLLLLGGPLVEAACDGLRARRVTSELLLVMGVAASFGYSLLSLWQGREHVYFEVACMILVAVTLGRWLEASGRHRATQAMESLRDLLPETVRVVNDDGEQPVPLDAVLPATLVRVVPGERIPLDGIVAGSAVVVDEQILSGESTPLEKLPGDAVRGGSLHLDGDLLVRVTAPSSSGTIARLTKAIQEAMQQRGPQQRLADTLASWFVPVVGLIALAVLATYWSQRGFGTALMVSLSVIVIACPCALAIATPLATWIAISTAARRGILFRHGEALSRLARVHTLCVDKTGTLTSGEPRFVHCIIADGASIEAVWQFAFSLAGRSRHPLSLALVRSAPASTSAPAPLRDTRQAPGRGMVARSLDGHEYFLGSLRFAEEHQLMLPRELADGLSRPETAAWNCLCVGWSGRVQGVFFFAESERPSARTAMAELRDLGVRVIMLTGDREPRAAQLAQQLGICEYRAELLPEQKLAVLQQLRESGQVVAMLGDGVNDAPALAASDVGIALSDGADISRDAAAVCLWQDDLTRIPWSLGYARRAVRTIHRNLAWALCYNVVGISFAASGHLNPILAAVAMIGSSLFVIVESLRLADRSPPTADTILPRAETSGRRLESLQKV